jgi:hypothetical protein
MVKEAHALRIEKANPYISARNLFWNIREVQDQRQAKGGAA